ncbi:CTD kinase subunit gamma CTK3-domain-containing protein [Gilbertella persicaria]|uniref:CTD kinase subunit gamma CTK3-domain-containing protein n=1 Tax=Gilbertella persicaria TaxID=101096 RepID=UPI00221F65A5|nr:CTD kinase subunit gamma CTK3-domain-containing protein [Gilbertella persicaria]KAI8086907.1 CTD kinase subunit gamma CTK3-domain-containing protein [Gilbertella persicaria]
MSAELDPFECRLEFIELLRRVNASQQSIHKAAIYAMRHRKLSEDLYSCLVEELEQATLNARLNIIYVLDAIFSASQKSKFSGYIDLTRPDLPRIIHAVVATEPQGVVNIPNTQKIISNWKRKEYFEADILEEAEKPLLESASSIDAAQTTTKATDIMAKDDILRRMEEDRERHKRSREEIWIRPPDETKDAEFEEFWNSIDVLDPEYDYEIMMVQNMLRLPNYAWHAMLNQRTSTN